MLTASALGGGGRERGGGGGGVEAVMGGHAWTGKGGDYGSDPSQSQVFVGRLWLFLGENGGVC